MCMATGNFGGYIPIDQAVSEGRPRDYGLSLFLYGVPFRTLECEIQMLISEPYVRTDTIMAGIAVPSSIALNRFGIIPLRPIWPGFAVNTVFYAAILWLIIPGPFVLRRFIRRRRGRCPDCGYPMVGKSPVCTECGMALPGRTGALT